MQINSILRLILAAGSLAYFQAAAGTANRHYYAHDAVVDSHGVIAPWYKGLNGQCDFRVRIAAETLKRYPWTTTNTAIAAYPDYVFSGQWQITSNGVIIPKTPSDWDNGDIGQRSVSVLMGMVDYYRYSGDPAAIAHLTYMGDFLLDYCQTPPDHPWPSFLISAPVKGKAYWNCNTNGMIQLDQHGTGPAPRVSGHRQTTVVRRRQTLGRPFRGALQSRSRCRSLAALRQPRNRPLEGQQANRRRHDDPRVPG
jgi:hypothetical protein